MIRFLILAFAAAVFLILNPAGAAAQYCVNGVCYDSPPATFVAPVRTAVSQAAYFSTRAAVAPAVAVSRIVRASGCQCPNCVCGAAVASYVVSEPAPATVTVTEAPVETLRLTETAYFTTSAAPARFGLFGRLRASVRAWRQQRAFRLFRRSIW